ncbi:hypothetical protein GCM10028806_34110 [Spirosoma terrae]|uniref:Crassvirus muzzle protein N-terminal region domain-containing protein n=1 Tax=Spirosoma terrae TaxID=1968276 RepID=A0A6L9L5D7_9BACT|nr:hypothetical protein [Spirosoma terrae]NDU95724.1 hypothetical protein [Spirosoma terrae]
MTTPQAHSIQAVPGMNRDVSPGALPEGASPYLLNAALSGTPTAPLITNEPSTLLAHHLPAGFGVAGYVAVPAQERLLLFLAPKATPLVSGNQQPLSGFDTTPGKLVELTGVRLERGIDNLGSVAPCVECPPSTQVHPLESVSVGPGARLTVLVEHFRFNFNLHHPIDAQVRLDDCRLRLYWVDGYNPDRYLYFTYSQPLNPLSNLVLDPYFQFPGLAELDLNRIRMQPLLGRLRLQPTAVVSGGNLPAGTYRFLAAYADAQGNALSDYQGMTYPVSLSTRQTTEETDYDTGQAIRLTVTADTASFPFYNLVMLQNVDGALQSRLVGTFPIDQGQLLITGNETMTTLPLAELLSRRAYYESSKGLTESGNKLFTWGLTEYSKPNLQRVVNSIRLGWATTSLPEGSYRNGVTASRMTGYPRDEVIAVGLVFEYDTGEESCVLHLPGRIASTDELKPAPDNADRLSQQTDCNPAVPAYWQVYNTARTLTQPHQPYDPCKDTIWETGEMGYWESVLRYPNDPLIWGELAGKPIRHHRLPDCSISPFHDGTGDLQFGAQNMLYVLGLQVDHGSVINALADGVRRGFLSEADRLRIKGYRLVRADMTGQASVLAKGLLYDVNKYQKDDQTVYYPNYPYNDLRTDPFLSSNTSTYDNPDYGGGRTKPRDCNGRAGVQCEYRLKFDTSGRYTFHSPEHHFLGKQRGLSGDKLVLETLETGQSEGYFEEARGQAHYRFLSTFASIMAAAAGIALFFAKDDDSRKVDSESIPPVAASNTASTRMTFGEPVSTVGSTSRPLAPSGFNQPSTGVLNPEGPSFISHTLADMSTTVSSTQTGFIDLITDAIASIVKTAVKMANPASIVQLMQSIALMREILTAITPYHNFALQYNSVGRYVNSLPITNGWGHKIRALGSLQSLEADWQDVDDNPVPTTGKVPSFRLGDLLTDPFAPLRDQQEQRPRRIRFNNWHRESATYLRIRGKALPMPSVEDKSRFVAAEVTDEDNLSKRIYAPISSYYGSIKANRPDQYGNLETIRYVETGYGSIALTSNPGLIFGGGTFIGRMSLKRKHSFFRETRFKAASGTDVRYEKLGNVAYPNYYLNTLGGLLDGFEANNVFSALGAVVSANFGAAKNRLDLDSTDTKVYFQKGYMYLYSYGIPSFLCESSINLDLRHGREGKENSFYPATANLSQWLQEEVVSPAIDNRYFYNPVYSRVPQENSLCGYSAAFRPGQACRQVHPNRIRVSLNAADPLVETSSFDRWLTFRPNDIYDAGASRGLLTGVDGIAGDRLLVRQQLSSRLFGGMLRLDTSQQPIQLGAGELFAQQPQEYIQTDGGYAGSSHKGLLRTEYGIVTLDVRNRKVFLLSPSGEGLQDLTQKGMQEFFERHLPFRLQEQFPQIPVDNTATGCGISMGFDRQNGRILLSKRDYVCRDASVRYDTVYNQFYRDTSQGRQVVPLSDSRAFTAAHWTVGYYLNRESWVFYSFQPQAFLPMGPLLGAWADDSLWIHGATRRSFQVFYGRLHPFVIDVPMPAGASSRLQAIQIRQQTIRYRGDDSYYLVENEPFRQAVIWGPEGCSGYLQLEPDNGADKRNRIQYRQDRTEVPICRSRSGFWRLNNFRDISRVGATQQPVWLWETGGSRRILNQNRLQYGMPTREASGQHLIQAGQTLTLINTESRYQYQFMGVIADQPARIPQ